MAVRERGFKAIAGVDEAGRGPLAGPVVAAACVFKGPVELPGVHDSKQLSASRRERLFDEILAQAICGIGVVAHDWIDKINILQATHRAMHLAVQNLGISVDYILVDGHPVPFSGIPTEGVIKGDATSTLIAAASILAKVTRDRIMMNYDALYPKYLYGQHKGYGTAKHRQLIAELGFSPIQRQTFYVKVGV